MTKSNPWAWSMSCPRCEQHTYLHQVVPYRPESEESWTAEVWELCCTCGVRWLLGYEQMPQFIAIHVGNSPETAGIDHLEAIEPPQDPRLRLPLDSVQHPPYPRCERCGWFVEPGSVLCGNCVLEDLERQ